MAFRASYASVEEIPEDQRSFYREMEVNLPNNGKKKIHILDVTGSDGFALENVSGLKSALATVRGERDEFKGVADKFKDLDPDKVTTAVEFYDKRDQSAKDIETKISEKVTQATQDMATKHKKVLADYDLKLKTVDTQLADVMIEAVATKEITDRKGATELLMPIVRGRAKLAEIDGKKVVQVLDEHGNTAFNAGGGTMTIGDLIEDFRGNDRYARAFDGNGQSGGGTPPPKSGSTRTEGNNQAPKIVKSSDKAALSANMAGIADGTVTVVD